jgi:hypothetical protein
VPGGSLREDEIVPGERGKLHARQGHGVMPIDRDHDVAARLNHVQVGETSHVKDGTPISVSFGMDIPTENRLTWRVSLEYP